MHYKQEEINYGMKRKKILHMPLSNVKGGVESYVLENLRHIDKNKYQFDILTRSKDVFCLEDIRTYGGKILNFTKSADEDSAIFDLEISSILQSGYDAVHLHTSFWKGFRMEEMARKAGCSNIIVHAHSSGIEVCDIEKRSELLLLHERCKKELDIQLVDSFLACSGKAAEWVFGRQVPRNQIFLMNNAIDLKKYQYNEAVRTSKRREEKLTDKFVIGNVARFCYAKNHEFLLEVIKETVNRIADLYVILIGDGILLENIRMKIKQAGLEHVVKLYGEREDVPELLQAMDLFLLPSRFEGLPITLIEAQAAGLPCIACENITEEADITGNVAFLPYDCNAWVEKAVNVYRQFKRIGTSDKIRDAGYDIEKQIKVLEKLYDGQDISKECRSLEQLRSCDRRGSNSF